MEKLHDYKDWTIGLACLLASCTGNPEDKFVGAWFVEDDARVEAVLIRRAGESLEVVPNWRDNIGEGVFLATVSEDELSYVIGYGFGEYTVRMVYDDATGKCVLYFPSGSGSDRVDLVRQPLQR